MVAPSVPAPSTMARTVVDASAAVLSAEYLRLLDEKLAGADGEAAGIAVASIAGSDAKRVAVTAAAAITCLRIGFSNVVSGVSVSDANSDGAPGAIFAPRHRPERSAVPRCPRSSAAARPRDCPRSADGPSASSGAVASDA